MRPNKLESIKAEQLKANPDLYAKKTDDKAPKKRVKKSVAGRKTKLDVIKKKQAGNDQSIEPSQGVSKLRDIKTAQLADDPTLYSAKTHVAAPAPTVNHFEQLQAAMVTDIARIKTAKNIAEKKRIKADLLPNYVPFVDDYIANEHDYPNSVAVQVMVWLLDVGDIEQAMHVAQYLITLGNQHLPANFKCDIPTLLCREMYEWANTQLKEKNSAEPYLGQLVETVKTSDWDLPIAVKSQTFVIAAKHAFAQNDFKQCLALCSEAEMVNPDRAGVKTLKANADKALKK